MRGAWCGRGSARARPFSLFSLSLSSSSSFTCAGASRSTPNTAAARYASARADEAASPEAEDAARSASGRQGSGSGGGGGGAGGAGPVSPAAAAAPSAVELGTGTPAASRILRVRGTQWRDGEAGRAGREKNGAMMIWSEGRFAFLWRARADSSGRVASLSLSLSLSHLSLHAVVKLKARGRHLMPARLVREEDARRQGEARGNPHAQNREERRGGRRGRARAATPAAASARHVGGQGPALGRRIAGDGRVEGAYHCCFGKKMEKVMKEFLSVCTLTKTKTMGQASSPRRRGATAATVATSPRHRAASASGCMPGTCTAAAPSPGRRGRGASERSGTRAPLDPASPRRVHGAKSPRPASPRRRATVPSSPARGDGGGAASPSRRRSGGAVPLPAPVAVIGFRADGFPILAPEEFEEGVSGRWSLAADKPTRGPANPMQVQNKRKRAKKTKHETRHVLPDQPS